MVLFILYSAKQTTIATIRMASFKHTVTRNLQCPVCLELMTEPTQLSCSHTFCKGCLASLMTRNIPCPTCHQKYDVVGGDESYLKENFPLKDLIADVKDKGYPCNVCQAGSRATCYCCDCDKNICRACSEEHTEWLLNKNHKIISLSDMRQGKVVIEKGVICKEHEPGEEEHECTDVCVTCEKFICIKCRVRNHEGHIAQSAADFKAYSASEVRSLQARAGCKIREMNSHIDSLQADRNKVVNHLDGLKQQIDEYYEDLVRILNERKSVLQMQCDKEKAKLCQTFDGSITSIENLCESIKSASDVAGKSTEAPLKTDTISTYYSSRRELNRILNRNTLVNSEDPEIFRLLQTLYFEKNLRKQKELELGQVQYVKLELKRCVDLGKDCMNAITTADAFCMAVGSQFGGARIYNVEGDLKRTILKDVNIRSLAAFVGGWYAVGDLTNAITVYQLGGSKCNVSFKSLSHDDGGHCGFTIDSCNNLYVSYRKAKKIYRFDPGVGMQQGKQCAMLLNLYKSVP